jgi:hypothetical protein
MTTVSRIGVACGVGHRPGRRYGFFAVLVEVLRITASPSPRTLGSLVT